MRCPTCKKEIAEVSQDQTRENWFPFCSQRCQLIDLGHWLDGKYQIPVAPEDEDESYEEPGVDTGI